MITNFNLGNGGSGYDDTELRERLGQLEEALSDDYYNKNVIDETVEGLENELSQKTDNIDFLNLQDRVEEIELFSTPNVTIYGEPTIQGGQVSGFSATNYLKFPYLVHLHDRTFEIRMCITTGANVMDQGNIIDSEFGLAVAIKNAHLVLAMSSTGTSWDMGEYTGTYNIISGTTYHIRLVWDKSSYKLYVGDTLDDNGEVEYTLDINVVSDKYLAAKEILIGKDTTSNYIFNGSVNLNHCYLIMDGKEVWKGVSGTLETDLSNLSDKGAERIRDLAKEVELIWYGTQEEYDQLEDKTLYKLYVIQ